MMTTLTSTTRRKNLVILRAGDNSLHPGWLAGGSRDFDLLISYYGNTENRHREAADLYEMRKGPKWSCIGDLLQARPELLEQYDAFWFPDDDLEANTATLNRMFSFFHAFELALAQPALTRDSYYSWDNLLQRDDYILRFVKFVEVMAPIFDRPSLKACLKSFGESRSGWGLDWLWPELVAKGRTDRIGLIDATPVKHTRPLGGDLYKNNPELDPRLDEQAIIDKYGLHAQRTIAKYELYGGVVRQGADLKDQLSLGLRKLNSKRLQKRRARQKEAR